jgi:membrane fusion protein
MGTDAHEMPQAITDHVRNESRIESGNQSHNQSLFRKNATRSAGSRLFGSVVVMAPPSSVATLAAGLLALLAFGFVAWYVEIPQRARAVGVLMPPGGFLDVVADAPGRVVSIDVAEGSTIAAGDPLLNITTNRKDLVLLQLQSLQEEIVLLGAANARQEAMDESRSVALAEQLEFLGKQLDAARSEHDLQQHQVELLERRLQRRKGLANDGNLSRDSLDREQFLLLQARAGGAALWRSIIRYEQDAAAVSRARADMGDESGRKRALHKLEHRRLQRQIEEHEYLIDQVVRAPESGTVARVIVRPGAAVRAGDALVRLYRRDQGLEAWLYLSSSKAGFLRAGQSVQLRFDAYPYQLFGTSTAVVTSVSKIAIVPQEVRVPLVLTGPVFEVRATLEQSGIDAFDATWQLTPGTSFQADLVQRRYRLYEWLLRAVVKGSDKQRA